jgi:hypothetical protein
VALFCEKFTEERLVSWHPDDVDLNQAREDDSVAAEYRSRYKISLVGLEQLAQIVRYRAWAPIAWTGGKCLSANFVCSPWMALDFENPNYTLAQALREWADSPHVIGLTKSHGFAKGTDAAMDRFRIIVPWEMPITDLKTYEFNIGQLIKKYQADETCVDGARFFFPCREIVSTQALLEQRRAIFGKSLPRWISEFVKKGKLPPFSKLQGSRKWVCYAAGAALKDLGWSKSEIENLLHDAKFDRTGFDPREIDAAIKSAFKKGSH